MTIIIWLGLIPVWWTYDPGAGQDVHYPGDGSNYSPADMT